MWASPLAAKYKAPIILTNGKKIEVYKKDVEFYVIGGKAVVDALISSNLAKEDGIVLVSENTDNSILNGKNIIQIGCMNY